MFYLFFTIIIFLILGIVYYSIINRSISNSSKIRFVKLRGFVKNLTDDEIKDLISFLVNELRRRKYENKRKR